MLRQRRTTCLYARPCVLLALGVVAGCGSTNKPLARVTGTVSHRGQGIPGAAVMFAPLASESAVPGKPAIGITDAEGKFRLTTYAPGDGAVIGQHRVQIASENPDEPLAGEFVGPAEVEVTRGDNVFDFQLQ